jgi:hypothetical protein
VAAQLLRDVQGLTLEDARALSGAVKVAPQSKRLVLKKEDWLDIYFRVTAGSVQYRHAALLQGLCGMRPLELERGVTVRRRGTTLGVKIMGAKVRKTAGQEWREVFILAKRFPDWFLQDLGRGPKVYAVPRGDAQLAQAPVAPRVSGRRPRAAADSEQLCVAPCAHHGSAAGGVGCGRDGQGARGEAGRDGEMVWAELARGEVPANSGYRDRAGEGGDGTAGGAAGVGFLGEEERGEGWEEEVGWAFESVIQGGGACRFSREDRHPPHVE